MNIIKCKICNEEINDNSIGMHLKHKHNITSEEYYLKYIKNEKGKCICGKETKFISILRGYKTYCSPKCARNDPIQIKHREETCLQKYGVKCSFAAKSSIEKRKKTCIEKYGNAFPQCTDEIKILNKKRCLEKYGEISYTKTDEFKNKVKQNCKNKSNGKYEWTSQFPDVIKKRSETFKMNKEQWLMNYKNTCLEKYGVENPMQIPELRKKTQHKYTYNNKNFDSSAELAYYIWLKDHNIDFEYQPNMKFTYEYNNKEHVYQPDFKINNEFIEIKGLHFFENDKMINPYDRTQDGLYEAKHQCMIKNNVKIITNYSEYIDYINQKYTKDFITLFRNDLQFPYLNQDLYDKSDLGLIHYFHKSIYEAHRKNKPSPIEAWNNKELIYKCALNRLKYIGKCKPNDILQGFNVSKIAPKISVFKPVLATSLIKKYLNEYNTIIDPFSGFSGRLLGSYNCNKEYIGYDINEKHVQESNEIINYKQIKNSTVEIEDLISAPTRTYENSALFTCPPYGGKEHWNKDNDEIEKSCDEWIDLCIEKHKCLKYLFVVDKTEKYKDYIIETLTNKSHFGTNNEYIIVIESEKRES